MKNKGEKLDEEFGDPSLPGRYNQAVRVERGPVMTILFEAKDIVLGGADLMRRHPLGSIEVGSALAATGVAVGALVVPRLRHAH